jgi:hypothetical protein
MGSALSIKLMHNQMNNQFLNLLSVQLQAQRNISWPHFAGSALRGAFGRALRKATCVTGKSTCHGCPVRANCAYGVVFDPAPPVNALHPSFRDGQPLYILKPPALGAIKINKGENQQYKIALFPGAEPYIGIIQHALKNAAEYELFKASDFLLRSIETEKISIAVSSAEPNSKCILNHSDKAQVMKMTLRWLTPLRIQQHGKPLFKGQQLDANILIRAMLRRRTQWLQIIGLPATDNNLELEAANHCLIDAKNMQWHDISRFSGTQNKRLPLGGLIGSVTIRGPSQYLQILQPLIKLGSTLHIGKEAILGLGQYEFSEIQKIKLTS